MLYFNKSKAGKVVHTPAWWPAVPQLFEAAAGNWQYPSFLGGWLRKIPTSCPMNKAIWWNDTLIFYTPAFCKFNPIYNAIMILVYRELNKDGE